MHKKRGRGFGFYVDAAKRGCATPEKIDMLLHGDVLKNPPFKPQEKEMADLQTALTTALETTKRESLNATLDAWDKDEQQQLKGEIKMRQPSMPHPTVKGARVFGISNNVTRITFQYIRDNPYCVSGEVVAALVPKGFKKGSVTPIITQLVKAGQVQRNVDTRRLLALVNDYVPIPSKVMKLRVKDSDRLTVKHPVKATEERIKRKYTKRAQVEGIAALTQPVVEEAPRAPTTLLLNRNWTAQGVVDKLSVMQARQLYDLLKTIFGG